MIDNGFLRRKPDGSKYWVSESFTGLEEENLKEREKKERLRRGALEAKAECPYCGGIFSGGVLLRHYEKRHVVKGYWTKRIDEYFRVT